MFFECEYGLILANFRGGVENILRLNILLYVKQLLLWRVQTILSAHLSLSSLAMQHYRSMELYGRTTVTYADYRCLYFSNLL